MRAELNWIRTTTRTAKCNFAELFGHLPNAMKCTCRHAWTPQVYRRVGHVTL